MLEETQVEDMEAECFQLVSWTKRAKGPDTESNSSEDSEAVNRATKPRNEAGIRVSPSLKVRFPNTWAYPGEDMTLRGIPAWIPTEEIKSDYTGKVSKH